MPEPAPRHRHMDHYFGLWAMEPTYLKAVADSTARAGLNAFANHVPRQPSTFARDDDIAVFELSGPTMKFESCLVDSTGTVSLRRQLRAAARDDSIRAGVIRIDSPGGTFAGQGDLIREIENFKSRKPLWTFAEDIAASAAYWAFATGDRSYATPETVLGSIGTFSALYDESGAYEADKIKVHTFTTGPLKGQGLPGSKPSEEYLAYWQEMVEQANEFFLDGIAKARKLSRSQVNTVATGAMHFATEAKRLGMLDKIGSYDEMMTDLRATLRTPTKKTTSPIRSPSITSPSPIRITNPMPTTPPTDHRAIWNAKLEALQAQGMTKAAATRKLVSTDPALHKNYLLQANAGNDHATSRINRRFAT